MRSCLEGQVEQTAEPFATLAAGEQPTLEWVAGRLEPLSYLLSRPCPTRSGFAFAADHHFYELCDRPGLQEALDLVLAHVGLPRNAVGLVAFDPNLDSGLRVHHARTESYVQLSSVYAGAPFEIGALLAHASAHVLARRRHLPVFGGWEDEINIDLIAILCGLGSLMAAPDVTVNWLVPEAVANVHAYVLRSLDLDPERASSGPALRFGPPAEATQFRCPGCGKGMRIRGAAGRRCVVTCKRCGESSAFDGRLCRVDQAEDDAV